ncbi:MAG: hypothetical protein WKF90_12055 [Pyrinomonadaceae bacterium]
MTNENKTHGDDELLEMLCRLDQWEIVKLYVEARTDIDVEDTEYYHDELEDRINECAGEISKIIDRVKSKAVIQNLKGTLGTK